MSNRMQIVTLCVISCTLLTTCDPPSDIATVGMLDSLRTECSQADEHLLEVNNSTVEVLRSMSTILTGFCSGQLTLEDSVNALRDYVADLESRLYDLEQRVDSLTAIANDTTWTGWRIEWDENTEPDLSHYSVIGMQELLAGTMRLHRPYLRVETVRPWVAVDTVYKGVIYVSAWDTAGNQATAYKEVK